jgi:hypothetical protein
MPLFALTLLVGCSADGNGVEAAADILPAAEPLADLRVGDSSLEVAENERAGVDIGASLGDDSFGSLGLLAPALPALGLETYSTSCDPFEDPYGTCL